MDEIPKKEKMLQFVNQKGLGYFPEHMGIEFTLVEPDLLKAKLTVKKELMAPNGYLHAATVIGLADSACGMGAVINLEIQGAKTFTTIELKSNFLSSTQSGNVLCEARPVHIGKSTHVWDAIVTSEETGKTMALFRCTQMIIW